MTALTRNVRAPYEEPAIPVEEVGQRVYLALSTEATDSAIFARALHDNPDTAVCWLRPDLLERDDKSNRRYEHSAAAAEREAVVGRRYAAAALVEVGRQLRAEEQGELRVQALHREHGRPDLANTISAYHLNGIRRGIGVLEDAWLTLLGGRLKPLIPDGGEVR